MDKRTDATNNSPKPKKQGKPLKQKGRKRKFGAIGILNVAATNLLLQGLLAIPSVSILAATLISQSLNTVLGYSIYGKVVFKAKKLRAFKPAIKYIMLMALIWLINWSSIRIVSGLGINRNLSAAAMIPVLAVISYASQKNWVFRE